MTIKPIDILSIEALPPILFAPVVPATMFFDPIGPASTTFAPTISGDEFLDFCIFGPSSIVFQPTLNPPITMTVDIIGPDSYVGWPTVGADETMVFGIFGPGSYIVPGLSIGTGLSPTFIGPTSVTYDPTLLNGSMGFVPFGPASIVYAPILGFDEEMSFELFGPTSRMFDPTIGVIELQTKTIEKDGGLVITVISPLGLVPDGFYNVVINGITAFSTDAGESRTIRTILLTNMLPNQTLLRFAAPPLPVGTYDVNLVGIDDGITRLIPNGLVVIPHHYRSRSSALRKKLSVLWNVGYTDPSKEGPQ